MPRQRYSLFQTEPCSSPRTCSGRSYKEQELRCHPPSGLRLTSGKSHGGRSRSHLSTTHDEVMYAAESSTYALRKPCLPLHFWSSRYLRRMSSRLMLWHHDIRQLSHNTPADLIIYERVAPAAVLIQTCAILNPVSRSSVYLALVMYAAKLRR